MITVILEDGDNKSVGQTQVPDVLENLLPGIVGFTLKILSIEGKFKFNQNRSKEDQEGVIKQLGSSENSVERDVAKIMRKNLNEI